MRAIRSKLPAVGTNIFTRMSALAAEFNAVNLGQGFPDFPMDRGLIDAVEGAMRKNLNQYSPMPGWMPLREVLAEKITLLYKTGINPDTEITITPGGTYAIYTALTAILEPGDEVIVLEPAYDSYIPNILVNGGRPVLVALNPTDFSINWQAVREAITPATKAIILNSPHNPTGSVITEADIAALRSLVNEHDIYIISDEVYEHLIFDGRPHLSLLRYPDLFERSFVCFSFGKTYHCTGWKLGYCVAPSELSQEFRKIHQFNCFSCHTPSQAGIAEILKQPEGYLSLSAFVQKKRDYFSSLMKETRFTLRPSFGSYFVCASFERITEEADHEFAIRITKEYGVASIPVSAFYLNGNQDGLLRFCFAKKEETLTAAVEKLRML